MSPSALKDPKMKSRKRKQESNLIDNVPDSVNKKKARLDCNKECTTTNTEVNTAVTTDVPIQSSSFESSQIARRVSVLTGEIQVDSSNNDSRNKNEHPPKEAAEVAVAAIPKLSTITSENDIQKVHTVPMKYEEVRKASKRQETFITNILKKKESSSSSTSSLYNLCSSSENETEESDDESTTITTTSQKSTTLMENKEKKRNSSNSKVSKICLWLSCTICVLCYMVYGDALWMKRSSILEKDSICVSGGGFSGFWYTLGRLQSISNPLSKKQYYCYSAGCLGVVAAFMNNYTGTEVYNIASNIQQQWKAGEISRYQVLETFVDQLVLSSSNNMILDDNDTHPLFSQLNVITTTRVEGTWFSLKSNIQKPTNMKQLHTLLIQTSWIPYIIGNNLWYNNHMDGAFSIPYHRSCQYKVGLTFDYDLFFNMLNVNLSQEKVEKLLQKGLDYGL